MSKNKPFSYCYRVYDYDQYLYDVGELRIMGYTIEDEWNGYVIMKNKGFRGLFLHVEASGVGLHSHSVDAERVPDLEYIINELPDLRSK